MDLDHRSHNSELLHIVSRDSIYGTNSESMSDNETIKLFPINFEFVKVAHEPALTQRRDTNIEPKLALEETKYMFPLFASSVNRGLNTESQQAKLMTVIIGGDDNTDCDLIHRPDSYYFASFLSDQKTQFVKMALTGQQILDNARIQNSSMSRCLDATSHNQRVHLQMIRQSKRSGKRSRLARIQARNRRLQMNKIFKQLWVQKRKAMKKMKIVKSSRLHDQYQGTRICFDKHDSFV